MVAPIETFEYAQTRAEHFLVLYRILHDTRRRKVRNDWADNFRNLMHWPKAEDFKRIDGENSILILRQELGISRKDFQHDYVSELLRRSLAFSISAMDLFFHDSVVSRSWNLLRNAEEDIPKELKKLSLSIVVTKRVIEQLKNNPSSRPSGRIKKELQTILHEQTFQSSNGIKKAFDMLGVQDCWTKVSTEMGMDKAAMLKLLNESVKRRNKIVHEADIILKTKAKRIDKRPISKKEVEEAVDFIRKFVEASNKVINDS